VFFQLLNNFDENSGLSRVLKEDADALGTAYNFIENIAKISLEVWAVLKGLGQGLAEAFRPISSSVSWASDKLEEFGINLFNVEKIAVRSSSRLEDITARWKRFGQVIVAVMSPIARVLMLINSLEGARENYVKTHGGKFQQTIPDSSQSQPAQPQSRVDAWRAEGQTSTQQSTPAPRAMNMDYSEDWSEILKKNNKLLEQQNTMMETDSQKQEIRESQRSAQDKVWTRR
jgi:hypothetical protein